MLLKFRTDQRKAIGECQAELNKMAESRTMAGGGRGAGTKVRPLADRWRWPTNHRN